MPFMTAPFGRVIEKKKTTAGMHLDAIYILAQAHRDKPVCNIDLLLSYSKEIVFLFSDEITSWDIKPSHRIRFESMENHRDFSSNYLSQKGNLNPSTGHRPNFDIPLKRSFSLFDAGQKRYSKILLLDDDIFLTITNLETGLTGLFDGMAIVGFHVVDYPDVSTMDHISRLVTNLENTLSMTGSCMFINVEKINGNFPNIYNEDLFFFMQQNRAESVVSGGYVIQKEYKPWLSHERIKHEQFGDLIYDAIKKRFLGIESGAINWTDEIEARKTQINTLLRRSSNKEFTVALEAALDGLANFDVKDIKEFLEANNFAEWVTKYL